MEAVDSYASREYYYSDGYSTQYSRYSSAGVDYSGPGEDPKPKPARLATSPQERQAQSQAQYEQLVKRGDGVEYDRTFESIFVGGALTKPISAFLGRVFGGLLGRFFGKTVAEEGGALVTSIEETAAVNEIRFSQSAADDLVVSLRKQHGGNVTVMKDGQPIFRVHQPGTHGNMGSTVTRFSQHTNPQGVSFPRPDPKVSPFDENFFDKLNQAINGKGGYSIKTRGGR